MKGDYRYTAVSDFGGGTMATETGTYEQVSEMAHRFVEGLPGDRISITVTGPKGKVWSYEIDKTREKP